MIYRNILALVTTGDWISWVKMQVKITRMLMISTITILLFGSFVSFHIPCVIEHVGSEGVYCNIYDM